MLTSNETTCLSYVRSSWLCHFYRSPHSTCLREVNNRNRWPRFTETGTIHIENVDQQQHLHYIHMDSFWETNENQQQCWRVASSTQQQKMQTQTPPFYQLVEKLFAEARLLLVQRKLVSEGKLSRFQRSVSRSNQSAIFSLWDQYTRKEITTKRLLHLCSSLNSPNLD